MCKEVKMSRQNFYKKKRKRRRKEVDEELVLGLVREERKRHPKMGTRKLYHKLKPDFEEAGVEVGRDRLFDILRDRDLLIKRRRIYPRTTVSRHAFKTYGNVLKAQVVDAPHQAWVSDLTYVRTENGFMYLSLITDAYSRKIVGYHIGDSLEAWGCMKALEMALEQLPAGKVPIHHSDRGTQYCCDDYIGILKSRGLTISMTEENHCYENAKAERVNGILKQEYGMGHTFRTKEGAIKTARQAVTLYNDERPHVSLNYEIPSMVHRRAA
jgi:transposase InsO family protein